MIFGIPDLRKHLTILAAALLLAGCDVAQPHGPDRVNADPIPSDPAMDARSWPRTAAVYPCFSTTTGSAQTLLVAPTNWRPYERAAMEGPIFVLDVALIPVAMLQISPFAQVEAASIYLPPSYTTNPPLEPRNNTNYSGGSPIGYTPASGRATMIPNQ